MTITINGNDVSAYVLGANKSASVCQIGSTFELILDRTCPVVIAPGHKLYFGENDLVHSGWVEDVEHKRPQETIRVVSFDCKPIIDYFFDEDCITNGEDIAYWINYMLDLVGMQSEEIEDLGIAVPEGWNFRYMTMKDALFGLIGLAGEYFVESDGNWKARLTSLNITRLGSVGSFVAHETFLSDSWIRNRTTVVWTSGSTSGSPGQQHITSGSLANTYLDPENLEQRFVQSNPLVHTEADAQNMVDRLLDFYETPLSTLNVTATSGSTASLGDYLIIDDIGHVVTSLKQNWLGNSIVQQIEADGRCHTIWDWESLGTIDVAAMLSEVDVEGSPIIAKFIGEIDAEGTPRVASLIIEVDVEGF